MTLIKRIVKTTRHLLYIVCHINWYKFFSLHRRGSRHVVISNFLTTGKWSNEGTCWEFGYISYLIDNDIPFHFCSLRKPIFDKIIYWSPEVSTLSVNLRNYPSMLVHIAEQLEKQGCTLHPSSYEVRFLENKKFMHEQFVLKDIPHPDTFVGSTAFYTNNQIFNPNFRDTEINFPVLWKGEHSSGSKDIEFISDEEALKNLIGEKTFQQEHPNLILQEFVDIRRDLRVNVIGDEVVLCFWRVNPSSQWAPTASKYGSTIQFDDVPTQLFPKFITEMKKLGLPMGGFDVIFVDDDPEKDYRILEVSTRYSPNPRADVSARNYSYADYKFKIFVTRSWAYLQTREIFKHASLYIKATN